MTIPVQALSRDFTGIDSYVINQMVPPLYHEIAYDTHNITVSFP